MLNKNLPIIANFLIYVTPPSSMTLILLLNQTPQNSVNENDVWLIQTGKKNVMIWLNKS